MNGQPLDPDYDPWPVSGVTAKATTADGVITIDLSGLSATHGTWTTPMPGWRCRRWCGRRDAAPKSTLPVRFLVDGAPGATVLATDVSSPVPPTSADSALSTVQVTSPTEGATVPTQFDVTGRAATFEANVVWELRQGERPCATGSPRRRSAARSRRTPSPSPPHPATYTLVVHDTDESDGEGVGTSQDTKTITVR